VPEPDLVSPPAPLITPLRAVGKLLATVSSNPPPGRNTRTISSRNASAGGFAATVLENQGATNPFKDWSMVFVPYCTSDVHAGDAVPKLSRDTPMKDAIYEISSKKLGMAVVASEGGKVLGVITDGDLRRFLEKHGGALLQMTAGECMHPNPSRISPNAMAVEALDILESRKITSLVVADPEGTLLGVLHLHDLWGIQLI